MRSRRFTVGLAFFYFHRLVIIKFAAVAKLLHSKFNPIKRRANLKSRKEFVDQSYLWDRWIMGFRMNMDCLLQKLRQGRHHLDVHQSFVGESMGQTSAIYVNVPTGM